MKENGKTINKISEIKEICWRNMNFNDESLAKHLHNFLAPKNMQWKSKANIFNMNMNKNIIICIKKSSEIVLFEDF